jgi:imidazolonepropionase
VALGGDGAVTFAIDHIGLLVTNDPSVGDGPLGIVRDAALVIEDGSVVAIERAGVSADDGVDADRRCVIPGFVDSHTHLVFAGDRSDEFVARMAGAPYQAGGITTTVAATRTASEAELTASLHVRLHEAHRNGITSLEIKSGYGLTVDHEARLLQVAATATQETTLLGAHVVPPEFAGRADDYVELVRTAMLDAAPPSTRWVDAFCEVGAFDADQCRAILTTAAERGFGTRLHANQLGFGPGVQLAVELGCASADHCTYLTDGDIEALAGGSTVATFLPATDFSTRQPYPDARRVIDAGARVALATNCNPGSSYTSSMAFCIALAVRDLHMTIEEAMLAATVGGAAALRRPDLGRLTVGSKADAVLLDAPSYTHLVYRPGMPLITHVWRHGVSQAHSVTSAEMGARRSESRSVPD